MKASEAGRVRGEKVIPEGALSPCLAHAEAELWTTRCLPESGESPMCAERALASLTIRGDPEGKGVDRDKDKCRTRCRMG